MSRTRVYLLLALVAIASSNPIAAQIPQNEREALIALYNNTDGANWHVNDHWLGVAGTECTWYGVTCSDGHVQNLGMIDNELRGVIPPELGNLSNLTILDLDTNYLNGSIPPQLGGLQNLEMLILQYNQLSGSIPAELGSLTNLWLLALGENQLTGKIPPQLGSLSNLQYLLATRNQLSGTIPPQLGNLSGLLDLGLSHNQLSGNIPPEIGDLSGLEWLTLQDNQLSGYIPPQLGDLINLERLTLGSNRLGGIIPPDLEDLSALTEGSGLDLRWNALHSDSPSLISFLDSKQSGGDWQSTQTVAPDNPTIDGVGDHTVWLSWDPPNYSAAGGFEVFVIPAAGGEWRSVGWTSAKTELEIPATSLDPGVSYELAVTTYTLPHVDNQNLVTSDQSNPVMATTANLGCPQPVITMVWGEPTTLSVAGGFDSYAWNTGETTPTIEVSPFETRFYWVTVTAPGSCQESAIIHVDEGTLFIDGFELGDTSAWGP